MTKRRSNRTLDGRMVDMGDFMASMRGKTWEVQGYLTVHQDGTLEFSDTAFFLVSQEPGLEPKASEAVH